MCDTEIRMMRYTIEELSEQIRLTKQELIRTRKALDIAVDALKRIDWCATDYGTAQDALDEITALEQKD